MCAGPRRVPNQIDERDVKLLSREAAEHPAKLLDDGRPRDREEGRREADADLAPVEVGFAVRQQLRLDVEEVGPRFGGDFEILADGGAPVAGEVEGVVEDGQHAEVVRIL